MNKKEVAKVLENIAAYYPSFKVNQDNAISMISTWHRVLKDYEFNNIISNLDIYVLNNKFAPTVADLINPQSEQRDRYIPSVEETRKMLEEERRAAKANADDPDLPEKREKIQAEIRKMLGIKRGG